jgi:hypothetical protein
MNGISIVSIECDDYFWLYVEGKKTEYCGHRCEPSNVVDAINDYIKENSRGSHLHSVFGINFETWNLDYDWVEDNGDNLPKLLDDIPKEAYE